MTAFFMRNEKGQIAIFVIVAVIIVALLLIFLFYPKLPFISKTGELSPISYLKSCIEPDLKKNVETLSNNAGYSNPEGILEYQGDKIKYLCYTAEYYKTCVVQQPLIKEHFEQELNVLIKEKTQTCVQNLKTEYEKRGYEVSLGKIDSRANINMGNILIAITSPMSVKKSGSSQSFSGFNIEMKSEMYDLVMIGVSVIDFESSAGDSETTLYMQYYPSLKIEKTRLGDGSKVYRLTNVETNESFRFASRSLVWPPGYGI